MSQQIKNGDISLPDTFLSEHKISIERETDDDIEFFVEQVLQELEAQLKETEITAVSTMQDRQETACVHLRAQVDDPDVGQASGNQQARQALWVSEMAFMELEAAAFLVGEEGLNGMITNDKFCVTRWGELQLSWWRRPLRMRQSPA